jgi:hypothetical protein
MEHALHSANCMKLEGFRSRLDSVPVPFEHLQPTFDDHKDLRARGGHHVDCIRAERLSLEHGAASGPDSAKRLTAPTRGGMSTPSQKNITSSPCRLDLAL